MSKLLPFLTEKTPAAQDLKSEREAFLTSKFTQLQDPARIAKTLQHSLKNPEKGLGFTVRLDTSHLPSAVEGELAPPISIKELERNPGYRDFIDFLGKYKLEITGDGNPTINESVKYKGFGKIKMKFIDIEFNLRANNAPMGRHSDPLKQVAAGMSIAAGRPKGDGPPPVPAP